MLKKKKGKRNKVSKAFLKELEAILEAARKALTAALCEDDDDCIFSAQLAVEEAEANKTKYEQQFSESSGPVLMGEFGELIESTYGDSAPIKVQMQGRRDHFVNLSTTQQRLYLQHQYNDGLTKIHDPNNLPRKLLFEGAGEWNWLMPGALPVCAATCATGGLVHPLATADAAFFVLLAQNCNKQLCIDQRHCSLSNTFLTQHSCSTLT